MRINKPWYVVIGISISASILINSMEFLFKVLPVINSHSKFLFFISDWLQLLGEFTIFPLVVAFVMIFVCVFFILFKKAKRIAYSKSLVACLLYILVSIPIGRIASTVRTNEFHKLAKRSTPLVNAIKGYEQKYSHPPNKLQDLVPEFLNKVPNTDMMCYIAYEYEVHSKDSHFSDRWKLYIFTPLGVMDFDEFVYYPSQKYPKDDPSGWYEPIEDWAYFHE